MRISDWSSDVCSSDLANLEHLRALGHCCGALVDENFDLHIGFERAKESLGDRQSGDDDRIAAVHHPAEARIRGDRRHRGDIAPRSQKIGRAHVCTPVPNAQLACRLLLEIKKRKITRMNHRHKYANTKQYAAK